MLSHNHQRWTDAASEYKKQHDVNIDPLSLPKLTSPNVYNVEWIA